jgi:hypothetical protein
MSVVVLHDQAHKTLLTSSRAGLPELVESSIWGADDGETVLLLLPMISRPGGDDGFSLLLIHNFDKHDSIKV